MKRTVKRNKRRDEKISMAFVILEIFIFKGEKEKDRYLLINQSSRLDPNQHHYHCRYCRPHPPPLRRCLHFLGLSLIF